MKYDMFAAFYEKANDGTAVYRCPLGIFCPPSLNYFENDGFVEDDESNPGYLDYVKEIDASELSDWTQDGYVSEVLDVLYCGKEYNKIVLEANELDIIDDEGNIPERGLEIYDTFVKFSGTEPLSRVTFIDGDPYKMDKETRWFSIPLKKLKDYFKVLTMMEVIERMQECKSNCYWSFEELKDYFEAGIDDAIDLATRVYFGLRDLDGNPAILHAIHVGMNGSGKTQMIVGFLHDVIEDSDITLSDLEIWGYSKDVIASIDLLTHRKEVPYKEYLKKIVASGNLCAIEVKMNELKHNIARAKAGKHAELQKKHEEALEFLKHKFLQLADIVDEMIEKDALENPTDKQLN